MKRTYTLIGILFIVLGLMMAFVPEGFIKASVIVIGVAAIVNGILNLLSVRNLIADESFKKAFTIRALLGIAVGVAAVFLPLILAGTLWVIMAYILAIELIISAGIEVYGTMKLRATGMSVNLYIGEAVVSIVLALLLFAMPAKIGTILVRIAGIVIILGGIASIIWDWRTEATVILETRGSGETDEAKEDGSREE